MADSKQTLLCTYLSAIVLLGLVLNAAIGWGWADPVAGLVIAAIALREARNAWRGEGCCAPTAPAGARPGGGGCSCCPPSAPGSCCS